MAQLTHAASLQSQLDHPNIMKYYECFQYSNHLCIVSEFCEVRPFHKVTRLKMFFILKFNIFIKKTLTNVLQTHLINKTRPSEQLIIEWFYKLSQGLNYLHDRDIIHRDIKPM